MDWLNGWTGARRWLARGYAALMLAQGLSTLRSLSPATIPSIRPLIQKQSPQHGQAGHRTNERANVAVSIIVPARDEASNITQCIQSLVSQWVGDGADECIEVITVDDASTDSTGAQLDALATAAEARLRVIHLRETPQGWTGKPYALHSGAQQAQGRWLLFTDADTRWQPGAVAALVAFAEDHQIDLLTTFPRQILPTPLERVVAPELVATLFALTSPAAVNSSRRPDAALANGQCILLRRAVYEAIGGFARSEMRGVILDDAALALTVKRAGYRLQVSAGQDLLTVRMYPSARAAWQGWLRNITASYRLHSPMASTLGLLGFTTFHLTPYALTLAGVFRWRRTRRLNETLVIGCLALGVSLFGFGRAIRALWLPWALLLAHPISVTLEQALLMQGWWRFMRRKPIMWKQRAYSPKPAAQLAETGHLQLSSHE